MTTTASAHSECPRVHRIYPALYVDCPRAKESDSLLVRMDNDGWTCRLNVYHDFNGYDHLDCPHYRPGDDGYCSACAPRECHHEHDHP